MSEYYNCNFKIDDIIIGINPDNKFTYLKLFRIKRFITEEEYGRIMVRDVILEHVTRDEIYTDVHEENVVVRFLNKNFKRLVLEDM